MIPAGTRFFGPAATANYRPVEAKSPAVEKIIEELKKRDMTTTEISRMVHMSESSTRSAMVGVTLTEGSQVFVVGRVKGGREAIWGWLSRYL